MKIFGIDFTSAPSVGKPLTCAACVLNDGALVLETLVEWPAFHHLEAFLCSDGPWLAAIDFPFGLPAEFIVQVGWSPGWADYASTLSAFANKPEYRAFLSRHKQGQPPGRKDLRRPIDKLVRSVSPLNVVRPPVGLMLFEGLPRLWLSNADIVPCRRRPTENRTIVEAYPALVARRWGLGKPYKEGTRTDAAARREARTRLLDALLGQQAREYYGFGVSIPTPLLREQLGGDGLGDLLDAFMAAIQGAWSWTRRGENFGIPIDCDANEGWIVDPETARPGNRLF